LTPARKTIERVMLDTLDRVIEKGVAVGIVSGSDLNKIKEQVGDELVKKADYTFSENGLYALRKG
jgi:phosphomannomutase